MQQKMTVILMWCLGVVGACGGQHVTKLKGAVALSKGAPSWVKGHPVAVCWVNPDDAAVSHEMLTDLQRHIDAQFRRTESPGFAGWSKCPETTEDTLRIRIFPRSPTPSGAGGHTIIGRSGKTIGIPGECSDCTMALATPDYVKGGEYRKAVLMIALHEFGHVVGLIHEHGRADRSSVCAGTSELYPEGTGLYKYITPYDASSIMSYCDPSNNSSRTFDPTFTAYDIEAINWLARVSD